ncbi:hypothetical protein BDV95DRAFT_502978 [Massariosphaeria phaeospora]|uniref:Uncharacterized protein n=1 Tax=Massariosphaeria phaeospora TaxID=100035 RepID=A0A7C8I812_9PLEO|nr:hypothetical protein BDV95DRAFT_502978 [Massariosphaeria phaeospora]
MQNAVQDAAPAYDDVFADHPVNAGSAVGGADAYAALPQADTAVDMELAAGAHNHTHSSASANPHSTAQQSFAPHTHCAECDVQLAARERRANERRCCGLVAATFMVAFGCAMGLGLAVVLVGGGGRRRGRD